MMMIQRADRLPRYSIRRGLSGLGYDPDAGYITPTVSGSSDVGTSWGSSLWNGILDLGKTYLTQTAQQKLTQTLTQGYAQPGQVIQAGGVVRTTQAAPVAVEANPIMDALKNPMVLGGLALGAYLLMRKRR